MNGKNALEEYLEETKGKAVIAAYISHGEADWYCGQIKANLPLNYNVDDFLSFLSELGRIETRLYESCESPSTIWYDDGSWSERGEYDGSEWWERKTCPEIPEELK